MLKMSKQHDQRSIQLRPGSYGSPPKVSRFSGGPYDRPLHVFSPWPVRSLRVQHQKISRRLRQDSTITNLEYIKEPHQHIHRCPATLPVIAAKVHFATTTTYRGIMTRRKSVSRSARSSTGLSGIAKLANDHSPQKGIIRSI